MRKDGMHLNRKLRLYLGTAEFYKRVGIIAIPIALQSLISIGVNMMDTVMPVSYTHLDVYKRQMWDGGENGRKPFMRRIGKSTRNAV